MNLHIFQDELGYYLCETYDRIERIQPGNNYYINLTETSKYKRNQIYYSQFDKISILEYIFSLQNVDRVYFHYYTYISSYILKKLKELNPKLIAIWVFWSGDFYLFIIKFLGKSFFW